MHVALFTHNFLEPTHHAIAQLIREQAGVEYSVFAKRFTDQAFFNLCNIRQRLQYRDGLITDFQAYGLDVVHAIYDGNTAIHAAMNAFEAEIPFFLSFHGGFDTNAKIFLPKYSLKTREIVQLAEVVSVPSTRDIAQLRKIGVTRKIEILPVPIDEHALPSNGVATPGRLAVVARLIPKKGIETAIHMLMHLPHHFHMVVVGDGRQRGELMKLAHSLGLSGRIEWKGLLPLQDMLKELANCEYLVHPACVAADGNADGTPQIILWAQAMRIPVVACNAGGIPELIEDRVSGLLVQPGDARALGEAILVLEKDGELRGHVIARACQRVFEGHTISFSAGRLTRLYELAVADKVRQTRASGHRPHCSSLRVAAPGTVRQKLREDLEIIFGKGVLDMRIRPFATGGQSILFLIRSQEDGNPFVLKIPDFQAFGEENFGLMRHKILKEVEALQVLMGLGIREVPSFIAADEEGNYLLRGYFPGPVLSEVNFRPGNRHGRCPKRLLASLLYLARRLFDAFHASQAKAYVIRDFKPRNLVLDSATDSLKLVDVGATKAEDDMVIKSFNKVRIGTGNWLYWAPEQLLNESAKLSRKVDYFALGCTGYYVLTGEAPYSNSEGDRSRLMDKYLFEYDLMEPGFARRCQLLSIPSEIVRFLLACMRPEAEERPEKFCCLEKLSQV